MSNPVINSKIDLENIILQQSELAQIAELSELAEVSEQIDLEQLEM